MVVETPPTAGQLQQDMFMMTQQEAQLLRLKNPDLIVREPEEVDLKKWSLSPEIFNDDVPWRGVRVTAFEVEQGLIGVLSQFRHTELMKKKWRLY